MGTFIVRITIETEAEDATHAAELVREVLTRNNALTFQVMSEETGKITVVRVEK